jgi:hypothetical protein
VTVDGGKGPDTWMQSQTLFQNTFNGGPPIEIGIEKDLPDVAPTDKDVEPAFGWLSGLFGL